ncbi:HNH endonuclease family protein [Haloquadratum walsbyi]|uniref:HNH endonuclease family protein n=1 Tax=Haloquadratum walsbyi TaxID=293091 RepID=UPI0000DA0209|nr:HNH endonuclease family protein [Haloquadratum walsbyi]
MQLSLTEQDRFNDEHWMPFEQKFEETDDYSGVDLTEFYRDYMMRTGEYVQKNEIYHQFKRRTSEMTPRELVDELSYYGDLYLWIQRPETAPNEELTNALRRLQYLEIGTAHQLVLNLLYRWDSDDLSIDELLEALHGLESFVLRRFICGRSTRGYYRTFPIAARSIEDDDVKGSLFAYLKSQGWPDDTELLDNILRFDMYNRDKKKTWLVLRTLEEQFGHKEPVQYDELTIEHVMPQTIDDNEWGDEWKAMLGDEWERIHDQWLHALGNLTLSGYNPELSNRPFDEKRELLMESHVELNGYFEECDNWTEKTIRERNQELAERLASIWRVPQVDD